MAEIQAKHWVDFGVYRNLYELSAGEDFVGASLRI